MQLLLYYSEDPGLLDNMAQGFREENENTLHLRNVDASEVELSLIQGSLTTFNENVIVENYRGSLDQLASLVQCCGSSRVLILLSRLPSGKILEIIDNGEDWKLAPLTNSTKKGYLNRLMSSRYRHLKIPKHLMDLIKASVPPCAASINEAMENIDSLFQMGMASESYLSQLLRGLTREFNFFRFLQLYLEEDESKWLTFFDGGVISTDSFSQFSYSLSYQLLMFKKFMAVSRSGGDQNSLASQSGLPVYQISLYGKLLKKYRGHLVRWLDAFIIELYNLHSRCIYASEVNCCLLKHLLLRQKMKLLKLR